MQITVAQSNISHHRSAVRFVMTNQLQQFDVDNFQFTSSGSELGVDLSYWDQPDSQDHVEGKYTKWEHFRDYVRNRTELLTQSDPWVSHVFDLPSLSFADPLDGIVVNGRSGRESIKYSIMVESINTCDLDLDHPDPTRGIMRPRLGQLYLSNHVGVLEDANMKTRYYLLVQPFPTKRVMDEIMDCGRGSVSPQFPHVGWVEFHRLQGFPSKYHKSLCNKYRNLADLLAIADAATGKVVPVVYHTNVEDRQVHTTPVEDGHESTSYDVVSSTPKIAERMTDKVMLVTRYESIARAPQPKYAKIINDYWGAIRELDKRPFRALPNTRFQKYMVERSKLPLFNSLVDSQVMEQQKLRQIKIKNGESPSGNRKSYNVTFADEIQEKIKDHLSQLQNDVSRNKSKNVVRQHAKQTKTKDKVPPHPDIEYLTLPHLYFVHLLAAINTFNGDKVLRGILLQNDRNPSFGEWTPNYIHYVGYLWGLITELTERLCKKDLAQPHHYKHEIFTCAVTLVISGKGLDLKLARNGWETDTKGCDDLLAWFCATEHTMFVKEVPQDNSMGQHNSVNGVNNSVNGVINSAIGAHISNPLRLNNDKPLDKILEQGEQYFEFMERTLRATLDRVSKEFRKEYQRFKNNNNGAHLNSQQPKVNKNHLVTRETSQPEVVPVPLGVGVGVRVEVEVEVEEGEVHDKKLINAVVYPPLKKFRVKSIKNDDVEEAEDRDLTIKLVRPPKRFYSWNLITKYELLRNRKQEEIKEAATNWLRQQQYQQRQPQRQPRQLQQQRQQQQQQQQRQQRQPTNVYNLDSASRTTPSPKGIPKGNHSKEAKSSLEFIKSFSYHDESANAKFSALSDVSVR